MYRHTSGWFIQLRISGRSDSSTGRSWTFLPWITRASTRPSVHELAIDVPDPGRRGVPREQAGMADRGPPHPSGATRIPEQPHDGRRVRPGDVALDEHARGSIHADVAEPAHRSGDPRRAAGPRLQGHEP